MNAKIKPLSSLERTALLLHCLYSGMGKSGLSAGDIAKYINRYGKGSASIFQVNRDLIDLVTRKLVDFTELKRGKQKRKVYYLSNMGLIELALMVIFLPLPIQEKTLEIFAPIYQSARAVSDAMLGGV